MFGLGIGELLIIGVLGMIFIGPKKLPEIAKTLGKTFREFKSAKNDFMDHVNGAEDYLDETVKKTVFVESENDDKKISNVDEVYKSTN